MIIAPQDFINAIESGNRDYQMLITCTLASGTILTIDNTRVWSSGFSYEDSLSTTPDVLEVGTAIINKMTLVINNMDEQYTSYDFGDAVLEVQIGLRPDDESSISYINKGIYTVDSASYNTMLITLTALDNMYKFDRLYGTVPQMPSTALALVQNACSVCGVTLGVQTFDGANTVVTVPPTADTTYRQMLAWIGQMIGCDWRINTAGELMPIWYDLSSMDDLYVDGEFVYDGESGYYVIDALATANVAVDDSIITGVVVRVLNDVTEEDAPANAFTEYSTGQEGFRIIIENNPQITEDNVQTVLSTLGGRLIGMRYRKGQLMHLSDPRLEAGDVFIYADHKGHAYPMICSQAMFALGQYQSTTSASAVPIRKAAERYGVQAQTTVQIYKSVLREKTSREEAEADLQEQIDNAPGLYQTVQSDGQGGSIYLLHNKPTVAESTIVWKMSSTAFGVSTNGGQSYNAGLTADGTAIVQRLYANTITAGILQSPDYAYTSGNYSSAGMLVDLANNIIRTPSFAVIGGNTYISASLTLGGQNNTYGTLTVLDASGTTIGTWNNNGLNVISEGQGSSFQVNSHGVSMFDKVGSSFFDFSTDGAVGTKGYRGTTFIGETNVFGEDIEILADICPISSLTTATNALTWDSVMVYFVEEGKEPYRIEVAFQSGARSFQKGTAASSTYRSSSLVYIGTTAYVFDFTFTYDGETTITLNVTCKKYSDGSDVQSIEGLKTVQVFMLDAKYYKDFVSPAFTIGTRTSGNSLGEYSATIGEGLVAIYADQTVIGKYNTASDSAFIIGNGTSDYSRSNIFTVDWNGYVTANRYIADNGGRYWAIHTGYNKGDSTVSSENYNGIQFYEDGTTSSNAENSRLTGRIYNTITTAGNVASVMSAFKPATGSTDEASISVWYPASGSPYIGLGAETRISGRVNVNSGLAVVVHQTAIAKGTTPASATQYAQLTFEDKTANSYGESTRLAMVRSYVDTNGLSYCGIHAYKNEAGSTSHTAIGAYYPASGDPFVYTGATLRTASSFGTGGKTAWNDTTNTGVWLTGASGQIHLSSSTANSGGLVCFHYNKSADTTLSISEPTSGTLRISGNMTLAGTSADIVRTDTSEVRFKVQNSLHNANLTVNSAGLFCLWSVTHSKAMIQMNVDGLVKVQTADGTMLRPVGCSDTDGHRVKYFDHASATTLRVYGQKGTAGANYSGYTTFTGTSSSDIRLKDNIKPVEVEALPLINRIELKAFDWIPGQRDYTHQPIGMIADQIEKLDSRLVIGGGYDPDGTPNYKIIDDHYLICYLTKAVQELSAKIKELERMKAA